MGRLCVGQGGTVLPEAFLEGIFPDAYLDWSGDYPGSQSPPKPPPPPPGDAPSLDDIPRPDTNMDAWAVSVLANVWSLVTGTPTHPRAILALAALSRSETFYGWPLFPSGQDGSRSVRNWYGHHNWVGLRCTTILGGRPVPCFQNQGCIAGFPDNAKIRTVAGWQLVPTCFEHQRTNLQGAASYVRAAMASGYESTFALDKGDVYELALVWMRSGMLVRTIGADEAQTRLDAAHYAKRMMAAARAIAQNTGMAMDLTDSTPKGAEVAALDPDEPAGPADVSPAKRGAPGWVATTASVLAGVAAGAIGLWAVKKTSAL